MKGWHAMHSKPWKQATSQCCCWAPAHPRASPAGCGGSCPRHSPPGQQHQEHLWELFLCCYCNSFNPVDTNPGSKPGRQRHNRRNHVWRGQQEPHPPHRQTHLHPDSTSGKEGLHSSPVTFALLCLSLTPPTTPLTISETWMLLNYQYSSAMMFSQVWPFLAVHGLSMWSPSAAVLSPPWFSISSRFSELFSVKGGAVLEKIWNSGIFSQNCNKFITHLVSGCSNLTMHFAGERKIIKIPNNFL